MNWCKEYFCLVLIECCLCKVYKNMELNFCYEIFLCYCNEN